MEIYTPILAVLDVVMTFLSGALGDGASALFSSDSSLLSFGVQLAGPTECDSTKCPGSFYTAIATAWANIGYLTHADVLRFINTTNFGKWAILLYIAAAIAGLLGVATNSPMRNYTWFFIGPALYSFLVGTTMEVTGVNWVVANKAIPDMSEVWKNAETGLANTRLAKDGVVHINGKNGPSRQYSVAMPMVFLDELFSATSNILIEWTGIGREVAGSGDTNLAHGSGTSEGPWWLLSTLKWGHIENIVATTARNPDVRDALVTFLGSECGDQFKEGINSGAYIAATQARGAKSIETVMIDGKSGIYTEFLKGLSSTSIPTPRSLNRLFKEKDVPGSFRRFSAKLKSDESYTSGRTHGVVCSEYLWVIIQALRFEAGAAYYQLLRSAPNGLDRDQFLNSFLYGWDVRKTAGGKIASPFEREAFVKHLMLAYLIRNELKFAPQITSVDQRFAPSQQARSYSDAYVGTYGSKAKFIELYNAAIMMPYLQGILAYFLIVSYPIACMLVILPGHYKGFFTWVSFFAWIKIWDVGFAMVQVIERSVWAMIGNHSHMATTANVLIQTAEKVGGVGFAGGQGPQPGAGQGYGVLSPAKIFSMETMEPIPEICSLAAGTVDAACSGGAGKDQTLPDAIELFDKMLLTSANLDLDLSNGWYIYIMSALYLAVPAVTGQLVLGAKAGSAGLVKDAFSGVGQDGGNAAKTGAQHGHVAAATTNAGSLGQAAYAKAMRAPQNGKGSLMAQSFAAGNSAMELGMAGSNAGLVAESLGKQAGVADKSLGSYQRAWGQAKAIAGTATGMAGAGVDGLGGGKGGAGAGSAAANRLKTAGGALLKGIDGEIDIAGTGGSVQLGQRADQLGVQASAAGMDASWRGAGAKQAADGLRDYKGSLGQQAHFEAESAAWEARNALSSHVAAQAGIAGMNAGNIAPSNKPMDSNGMAMYGMMDGFGGGAKNGTTGRYEATQPGAGSASDVSGHASYAGKGFQTLAGDNTKRGIDNNGSSMIMGEWGSNPAGGSFGWTEAAKTAAPHAKDWVPGAIPENKNPSQDFVQGTGRYQNGQNGGGANYFKPPEAPAGGRVPLQVSDVDTMLKK